MSSDKEKSDEIINDMIRRLVVVILDETEARGLIRSQSVTWIGKELRRLGAPFPRKSEDGANLLSELGFQITEVLHGIRGFRRYVSE